jgi:hypothetical protein
MSASLVAVRGLARSLHSNYGFQPQGALLVNTDLNMGGYSSDQQPQMQQRMLDAAAAIPGVTAAGYGQRLPLSSSGLWIRRLAVTSSAGVASELKS